MRRRVLARYTDIHGYREKKIRKKMESCPHTSQEEEITRFRERWRTIEEINYFSSDPARLIHRLQKSLGYSTLTFL